MRTIQKKKKNPRTKLMFNFGGVLVGWLCDYIISYVQSLPNKLDLTILFIN